MHRTLQLRARCTMLAIGVALAPCGDAGAQPLGAAPAKGEVEIGGGWLQVRRTVRYRDETGQANDWMRRSVFGRVGVTDRLTIAGDGWIWHSGSTDRMPQRDYWDVSAGLGAAALLAQRGPTRLSVATRFHMYAMLDQSVERYGKRTSHLTAAVLAEYRLGSARARLDLWAGPAYVRDRLTQVPPDGPVEVAKSQGDWGATGGGSLRLGRRLRAFGQLSYAGRWQPELGGSVLLHGR